MQLDSTLDCYIVLKNKLDAIQFPSKESSLVFYERLAYLESVLEMIDLETDLKLLDLELRKLFVESVDCISQTQMNQPGAFSIFRILPSLMGGEKSPTKEETDQHIKTVQLKLMMPINELKSYLQNVEKYQVAYNLLKDFEF